MISELGRALPRMQTTCGWFSVEKTRDAANPMAELGYSPSTMVVDVRDAESDDMERR
jgi:hypothetical protein